MTHVRMPSVTRTFGLCVGPACRADLLSSRPMKLLLFDVDGTLMRAHGAGSRAMTRAGRAVCGEAFSLEGVSIAGGLDPVIFADAGRNMGLADPMPFHDAFREAYFEELAREMVAEVPRKPQRLRGASELLCALKPRTDLTLALVTGNYQRAIPIKFAAVGLDVSLFEFGAFGGDAPTRPELVKLALETQAARRQSSVSPHDALVIGDTPRDVDCAHKNGVRCVAVATGVYSAEELHAAGADLVLEGLHDAERFLSLL